MPVPAFYPTSYYNPYMYNYQPPQPVAQPIMPQAQTPVQQQPTPPPAVSSPSSAGIIWIGSEKDAALYPVAPNNAVTLWNQNEPVVYLKQADASGKPTMITYDLIERSETAQGERNTQNDKLSAYATKDELTAVVGAVKDIDVLITSLSKDVDELKKKKRRREEDDD